MPPRDPRQAYYDDTTRRQPGPTAYSDYGRGNAIPTMIKTPVLYADSDRSVLCSMCKRSLYNCMTHIRGNMLLCDGCFRTAL
jgi:hypothetical protein